MPSRFRALFVAAVAVLFIHSPAHVRAQLADGPPVVSGWNNGPIDVSGGGVFGQVAALPLAKGIWQVRATAYLEGTTYGSAYHLTTCKLSVGGDVDTVTASPAGSFEGSMQPILLTMEHKFDGAGQARLLCKSDAATGEVKIRFVKLVGMKIGKLTRRPFGGTPTTVGKGTPRVIAASRAKNKRVTLNDTVASLPLPAGDWWITAKAVVSNAPGAAAGGVVCQITPNDGNSRSSAHVGIAGTPTDRVPIGVELAARLAAPGTVALQCSAENEVLVGKVRITAVKAGTLTTYFGPSPTTTGSENPVVVSGWLAGANLSPGWQLVRSMPLSAGSFAVAATVSVDNQSWVPVQTTCRLHLEGDFDEKVVVESYAGPVQAVMMFSAVHAFTAPGTAELWCAPTSPTGSARVLTFRITAIRAGSLENNGI